MIHENKDGNYVISSSQLWLEGVYNSKRAANYAFRFSDEQLHDLQMRKGSGVITFEDLKELRKRGNL